MAIKINSDKLNKNVDLIMANIIKANLAVSSINSSAIYSFEYKQEQLEKERQLFTANINQAFDEMKRQIDADVKASKVTQNLDFAAQTYYATIVKQEIEGLSTKQLTERYSDILEEGNEAKKKEFERLAVAVMKNDGDNSAVMMFKQKVYDNMTDAEKDAVDTAAASQSFLYNVRIIENQANSMLKEAFAGENNLDPSLLKTVWNQGEENAIRNTENGGKLI